VLDLREQLGGDKETVLTVVALLMRVLASLNLRCNNLDVRDGEILADVLKTNPQLTELDLMDNRLGSDGGKHIADALLRNRRLRQLNLVNNHIGVDSALAIFKSLEQNSTLTKLSLRHNNLDDRTKRKFVALAQERKNLEMVV